MLRAALKASSNDWRMWDAPPSLLQTRAAVADPPARICQRPNRTVDNFLHICRLPYCRCCATIKGSHHRQGRLSSPGEKSTDAWQGFLTVIIISPPPQTPGRKEGRGSWGIFGIFLSVCHAVRVSDFVRMISPEPLNRL